MDYRLLIIRLVGLVLKPVIEKLKEEAKKTPSPIDDSLIQIGEILLTMLSTGAMTELFKKS